MRILGRERLELFCRAHGDARKWIENWLADAASANWHVPQDIKSRYATASFLSGNRIVFNVKGNRYRMEVLLAYNTGTVTVRWIGTHDAYTQRMT